MPLVFHKLPLWHFIFVEQAITSHERAERQSLKYDRFNEACSRRVDKHISFFFNYCSNRILLMRSLKVEIRNNAQLHTMLTLNFIRPIFVSELVNLLKCEQVPDFGTQAVIG